jgi:CheY-like chemotaxis protein
MPGLSGFDVQSRMCASGVDIPVVFITASDDLALDAKVQQAGGVKLLRKPFSNDDCSRRSAQRCSGGRVACHESVTNVIDASAEPKCSSGRLLGDMSFFRLESSIGHAMLGFELDFLGLRDLRYGWPWPVVRAWLIYIWIAGLPGRIALRRNHPEAEAVKILGWAVVAASDSCPGSRRSSGRSSLPTSSTIRRFPKAEAKALDEEAARLNDRPGREQRRGPAFRLATHGASETAARRDQG